MNDMLNREEDARLEREAMERKMDEERLAKEKAEAERLERERLEEERGRAERERSDKEESAEEQRRIEKNQKERLEKEEASSGRRGREDQTDKALREQNLDVGDLRREPPHGEDLPHQKEGSAFSGEQEGPAKTIVNGTTGHGSPGSGQNHYSTTKTPKSNESIVVIDPTERFRHAKAVALEGERFLRRVNGVLINTGKDVARSDESGTVHQIENLNEARNIVKNSLKASKDASRQICNVIKVGQNAFVLAENTILVLRGKETKEYKHLVTRRSLAKEEASGMAQKDRDAVAKSLGSSEKKYQYASAERIAKKRSAVVSANRETEKLIKEESFLQLRQKARNIKEEIFFLETKGNLSAKEMARLEELKVRKADIQSKMKDLALDIKGTGIKERVEELKAEAKSIDNEIKALKKKRKLTDDDKLRLDDLKNRRAAVQEDLINQKTDRFLTDGQKRFRNLDARFLENQGEIKELKKKALDIKKEINALQMKAVLDPEDLAKLNTLKDEKLKLQETIQSLSDNSSRIRELRQEFKSNLQKILGLDRILEVRAKASEKYEDITRVRDRAKMEKLLERTEKKIKQAQYDSVGGKKEFHKINKLDSNIEKTQKSFDRLRAKTRTIKDQIKELEKKGALSPEEQKRLEKLKEQKSKNQNILKEKAKTIKKTQKERAQKGTVASRDSVLSKTDKQKISFIEESVKRQKIQEKMGDARKGRKGLYGSAAKILQKTAEESEETSVHGVLKASRYIQNQYVREAVKFYLKPFVRPFVKPVKALKRFAAKKVAGVTQDITQTAINVGAKIKSEVIHSKPVTHVRNVYTERREQVSEKLKAIENKASEKLQNVSDSAKKFVEKIPEPVRNRVGEAAEKVSKGAKKVGSAAQKTSKAAKTVTKAADKAKKAASKVLKAVKAFIMKFVLIVCGILLLIAILGAVLVAVGGAAQVFPSLSGLVSGSGENSSAAEHDLTSIITEQMIPIQQSWEEDVNDFLQVTVPKYDHVYVGFEMDAKNTEKEHFLRIILMAATSVPLTAEGMDSDMIYENFCVALRHLFDQVYGYELIEGNVTMCSGCKSYIVHCEGCKTTTPKQCDGCETQIRHCDGCETVVTYCDGCMTIAYCEGCEVVTKPETGENGTDTLTCPGHEEKHCPGHPALHCPGHEEVFCPGHTETYCPGHRVSFCPGHQDATLVITATSPEVLYKMENQNMKSPSPGFIYNPDFEGWTEENIEQLNMAIENAEDIYKGLELLDGLVVFKDYRK